MGVGEGEANADSATGNGGGGGGGGGTRRGGWRSVRRRGETSLRPSSSSRLSQETCAENPLLQNWRELFFFPRAKYQTNRQADKVRTRNIPVLYEEERERSSECRLTKRGE